MKRITGIAVPILLAAGAGWAHHSTSAVFDMSKPITVSGTLTKVDWINPHIVVLMEGKGADGKAESWKFESNPPAWYKRVGISRNDFAKGLGQGVTIGGVRAKDGTPFGYMLKVSFADGRVLEIGNPEK